MDEQQVKRWLGIGDLDQPLRKEIITGMSDVPYPQTSRQETEALVAFLRTGATLKTGIFQPEDPIAAVMTLEDVGAWYQRMIRRAAVSAPVRARVTEGGWLLELEPLPAREGR